MQRGVPLEMVRDYAGHKNFGRSYPVSLASWRPTLIWNLHSFLQRFAIQQGLISSRIRLCASAYAK